MIGSWSKAASLVTRRREILPLLSTWLFQLENRDRTFWGSVSADDEEAIIALVESASSLSGPIVEIGALFGFTTQLIASYKPTAKPLIAVENFSWNPFGLSPDDHRATTKRVLRYCRLHCNTSVFDGAARDFYDTYSASRPAMVFIDADHSFEGVRTDIAWAVGLDVPVISGHDYNEAHVDVMQAVNEAFSDRTTVQGSVWWHTSAAAKAPSSTPDGS